MVGGDGSTLVDGVQRAARRWPVSDFGTSVGVDGGGGGFELLQCGCWMDDHDGHMTPRAAGWVGRWCRQCGRRAAAAAAALWPAAVAGDGAAGSMAAEVVVDGLWGHDEESRV